ncbi:hypothetical protein CANARDRAFT_179570, partial [[Candida] arabinofermentans NRRL YB-2248]
ISKSLSKLLRHQAISENITIDEQGFSPLNEVLVHKWLKSLKATPQEVFEVVESNEKKRFIIVELKPSGIKETAHHYEKGEEYYISALQGHSISSVSTTHGMVELKSDEDWPQVIVHGTYKRFLKGIKEKGGLSKGKRNHVHCATGEKVISGMRNSCEVLIFLDVYKLKSSQLIFYKSGNGVILSAGNKDGIIGVEYFSKIVDVKNGSEI